LHAGGEFEVLDAGFEFLFAGVLLGVGGVDFGQQVQGGGRVGWRGD
jgi:hypothetical protein